MLSFFFICADVMEETEEKAEKAEKDEIIVKYLK